MIDNRKAARCERYVPGPKTFTRVILFFLLQVDKISAEVLKRVLPDGVRV